MDLKKLSYLAIIEIIFFALIILALVFVRNQQEIYINELQAFSPDVAKLQADIQQNNLTAENQIFLQKTIDEVGNIASKSLLLTRYLLPVFFIALFILFQIVYWYFAVKTPWQRIIFPALLQAVLALLAAVFAIDLMSYLLYGEYTSMIYILIPVSILLVLITLFNFHYFIAEQPFKLTFRKFLFSDLKIWFNIFVTMAILGFIIFFSIVIYVFTQVNLPLTPPIVLLLVFIIFANIQRVYLIDRLLVEKIKSLMKSVKTSRR